MEGPGGGTGTPQPSASPHQSHPWLRAATWWDPRARHRLGGDPTPTPGCHALTTVAVTPLRLTHLSPLSPHPLQHYTTDADGLCTRLIKPKVMEGTVAAQDEFSRSEWPWPFPGSLGTPPDPPSLSLYPSPPLPGGWALNMKDLKLLQIIGKGEFGGEPRVPDAAVAPRGVGVDGGVMVGPREAGMLLNASPGPQM